MTHSSSQSRRAAVDGAGSGRVQTHKRGLQLSQRGTGRDSGVQKKKKYQSHTENIGGRNTFCIQNFKRNRKERSETFDRISHQVHALPWLATGKRPRSRKPSLLSCGQNKYLRGQVKGGAPDTWNQPLLYIYMLNLKIWLVMPHTKNIQAHFVSSYA